MVFYFSSQTYQPMISKTITETDKFCIGNEVGEQMYFLKYVKEHIGRFKDVDICIVDLSSLADTDEEIIKAFESIRIMDYATRFIILASRRREGDELLKQCFLMGIYDLIATDDYLLIHQELTECLLAGKKYRDSIGFRDSIAPKVDENNSKVIHKVIVSIAGAGIRRGATHNSIVLANYLRSKKFMVAIAEMSPNKAFRDIAEFHEAKIFEDGYFTLDGVDFYPDCDEEKLINISGKLYNFIILDMGNYFETDKIMFNKSDVRIIISGSKAWEINSLNAIFVEQNEVVLKNYHFCFTFAGDRKLQKEIVESMKPLDKIYFPVYTENPFESSQFSEAYEILKDYLVQGNGETEKKTGLFGRKKKG